MHENIIRFCNRPFSGVEKMDEVLINNWNETVPNDGLVFHLGDFAWGGFQQWKKIRERLNGEIILIKGNHDRKNGPQNDIDAYKLFKFVTSQMFIEIEGRKTYLNHFPFLAYNGVYRSPDDMVWQLFGHVHSGPFSNEGKDMARLSMLFPTQYDVGVDNNNFRPISWNEVNDIITKQVVSKIT